MRNWKLVTDEIMKARDVIVLDNLEEHPGLKDYKDDILIQTYDSKVSGK